MFPSRILKNKVSLVTGATKGIGYGIAKGLAQAGSDLIVVSRNLEDCNTVASELSKLGITAIPISADVSNVSSVKSMVRESMDYFGKIDILINNAGMAITKPPETITESEWDKVVDLNLKGAFFVAQKVGKEMIKQQRGKIISLASLFSFRGGANVIPYAASKGGLIMVTKSLALAWARYNIHVNAIAPGYIKTEMNEVVLEKMSDYIIERTPLKRIGNIDDIIGSVIFLSSSLSDFITGQCLIIDGGWTIN